MVPKIICSSSLNLPPNHTKGEQTTTPGTFSISARWRWGSVAARETLLRTQTRRDESPSLGGWVSSRRTTMRVTRRKRLTAALSTLRRRRRLLRAAFFRMKVAMFTGRFNQPTVTGASVIVSLPKGDVFPPSERRMRQSLSDSKAMNCHTSTMNQKTIW